MYERMLNKNLKLDVHFKAAWYAAQNELETTPSRMEVERMLPIIL
jgi:hypothetical protein